MVAAGSGTRFGGPKQYVELGGRRMVDWALDAARAVCDGVVLVAPPDRDDPEPDVDHTVVGGPTRSASVRSGLDAVPPEAAVVVVHDAARPLAGPGLFEAVIAAVESGADAAVPAVPVADTLRRAEGGVVDREGVFAVQTPQAFRAEALRAAHAEGGDATDDATLVEAAGGRVVIVEGDRRNIKVTDPHDLELAAALLSSAFPGHAGRADERAARRRSAR